MSSVPENANEGCPGVGTEKAGKSSACEGCPNQEICASQPATPAVDPDLALIKDRMSTVKHKILVLSGKGGVGKSTLSAQLAFGLAFQNFEVGLMDIDICGPSIPRMMGLQGAGVHKTMLGWEPCCVEENLAVMSVGFLLENAEDAVVWRGPKKNGLIKNFLKDVYWGDLDILVVDTPPGTSDEHISIVQYLKETNPDGALIVTTPQDVALNDVRREINFCRKVNLPILGLVENMSGFVCPKCQTETAIFKPHSGGGRALAEMFDIPFLGSVPLDPRIVLAAEAGDSFLESCRGSPAAQVLQDVVRAICKAVGMEWRAKDGQRSEEEQ